MLTLVYFLIILGVIVLVHEGGHFLFAKLFGIYVYEFSIGMGPKIFSKKDKKGETSYSIRAIPIGGFVSLAGEEVDNDDSVPMDRKLYKKPIWQRFLVMFFGAGFNFISAVLVLFLIATIWGSPDMRSVISKVELDSPAYQEGLREGDVVLSVNGTKTKTIDDLALNVQIADRSKDVSFKVKRNNEILEFKVKGEEKEVDGQKSYVLGIQMGSDKVTHGFKDSIDYTITKTKSLFKQMVDTFKLLFTGRVKVKELSGPVGIYSIVGTVRESGFRNVLALFVLLSINVGFINLIPLPAFDGGRIFFLLIEKIKGSPVDPKIENTIHTVGFILLMILMLYITFNDIFRLF